MEWQHSQLQLDATWALTNILCGDESAAHILVSAGAIDRLCELADQDFNLELRNQAISALGKIAGHCREKCWIAVWKSRFIEVLLHSIQYDIQKEMTKKESAAGGGVSPMAKSDKEGTLIKEQEWEESIKTAVSALRIMCSGMERGKMVLWDERIPFDEWIGHIAPPIGYCNYIIKNHHNAEEEILIDACVILVDSFTCCFRRIFPFENVSRLVQDKDLWSRVVSFLYRSNYRLVEEALSVFRGIVLLYDNNEDLLDTGILSAFLNIIQNSAMP